MVALVTKLMCVLLLMMLTIGNRDVLLAVGPLGLMMSLVLWTNHLSMVRYGWPPPRLSPMVSILILARVFMLRIRRNFYIIFLLALGPLYWLSNTVWHYWERNLSLSIAWWFLPYSYQCSVCVYMWSKPYLDFSSNSSWCAVQVLNNAVHEYRLGIKVAALDGSDGLFKFLLLSNQSLPVVS